jgi:hypothetical protein
MPVRGAGCVKAYAKQAALIANRKQSMSADASAVTTALQCAGDTCCDSRTGGDREAVRYSRILDEGI